MEEEIRVALFQWLKRKSDENGGPMLKHGFQELENNVILLPGKKKDRPDPDRLKARFESFLSA